MTGEPDKAPLDIDAAEAGLRACRFPDDDSTWVSWYAHDLIAEVRRLRGALEDCEMEHRVRGERDE